jgi:hypothetical protein
LGIRGKVETMADSEKVLQDLLKRVEALEAKAPEDRLVLGVISGSLDYTMAAFIIALGAAASGMQVDMFFTFWAAAALRDPKKSAKTDMLGRMFGMRQPSSASGSMFAPRPWTLWA